MRVLIFLHLLFFISGLAGLTYQISWSRQFGLLFGQTSASAAAVLFAFFLGMGIGYVSANRLMRRFRHPLTLYACVEIAIGLWALAMPVMLDFFVNDFFISLINHDNLGLRTITRLAASSLIMLPATIGLGASFPLIAEALKVKGFESKQIVNAYAINTLGSVVGVLATTFFLFVLLGVQSSSYLAAVLSITCGLGAYFVDRKCPSIKSSGESENHKSNKDHFRWFSFAFVCGFTTLALEVIYTRLFSLIFHNSTYSFGLIIAVFLLALAIGSFLTNSVKAKNIEINLLFNLSLAGAIVVTASLISFLAITDLQYFQSDGDFYSYIARAFFLVSAIIFAPICIFGTLLPLVWKKVAPDFSRNLIGRLTGVNTIGAALGALAASFVILPFLDLYLSVIIVGLLPVVSVTFIFYESLTLKSRISLVCLGAFALTAWFHSESFIGLNYNETLVERWTSSYGWIDIVEHDKTNSLELRQNVHYGMGASGSSTMELRQGRMPVLFHPNPKSVLALGGATGITVGGILDHSSLSAVTTVELIPDVVEASEYFSDFNRDYLNDPRHNMEINDARHFLFGTDSRFDVIISDLFVPWESKTGYLYTEEHYQLVRSRLSKGGVFAHWIPLWQITEKEFLIIADTFAKVFPHTNIWWGQVNSSWSIMALVGSEKSLVFDHENLNQRLAEIRYPKNELKDPWLIDANSFARLYMGKWIVSENAEINSDEHPLIEFYTPISTWNFENRLQKKSLVQFVKNVQERTINQNLDAEVLTSLKDNHYYQNSIIENGLNAH